MRRRRFLKAFPVVSLSAVTGCSGPSSQQSTEGDGIGTESPMPTAEPSGESTDLPRADIPWRRLPGPQGGPVSDVAVSRADPDTIYATTRTAGVYASQDRGRSWIQGQSRMHHRREVFPSPHDATLAYTRNDRLTAAGRGGTETPWGVFHPGGESLFDSFEEELYALRFDAVDEAVRYAATSIGFFRSADAARTWDERPIPGIDGSPTVRAAAAHSTEAGTVIAAVDGLGAFLTRDGGESWSLVEGTAGILGEAQEIAFADGLAAYLAVHGRGIYRINDGPPAHITGPGSRFPDVPAEFDVLGDVSVSADDDRVYFITGSGLRDDHGLVLSARVLFVYDAVTRTVREVDTPVTPLTVTTHPDEPSTLFLGGLKWVHESVDGGETWTSRPNGFVDRYLTSVGVNPARTGTVFPGTVCSGGLFRSTDHGETFEWKRSGLNLFHGDHQFSEHYVMQVAALDDYAYATTAAGLLISVDNGASWRLLDNEFSGTGEVVHGEPNRHDHLHGLDVSPADGRTVYVGTGREGVGSASDSFDGTYVWRSENAGETWSEITAGFPTDLDATVQTIHVSRADPSVVYLGTKATDYLGGDQPGDSAGLFVSANRGRRWKRLPTPFDAVHAIEETGDAGSLFVSAPTGVYRSLDRGDSWSRLLEHESKGLTIHPDTPQLVFVGSRWDPSYWDLLVTTDGGDTWKHGDLTIKIGQDPADRPHDGVDLHGVGSGGDIRWLALDAEAGFLYATTHGAGLWRADVGGLR